MVGPTVGTGGHGRHCGHCGHQGAGGPGRQRDERARRLGHRGASDRRAHRGRRALGRPGCRRLPGGGHPRQRSAGGEPAGEERIGGRRRTAGDPGLVCRPDPGDHRLRPVQRARGVADRSRAAEPGRSAGDPHPGRPGGPGVRQPDQTDRPVSDVGRGGQGNGARTGVAGLRRPRLAPGGRLARTDRGARCRGRPGTAGIRHHRGPGRRRWRPGGSHRRSTRRRGRGDRQGSGGGAAGGQPRLRRAGDRHRRRTRGSRLRLARSAAARADRCGRTAASPGSRRVRRRLDGTQGVRGHPVRR